MELTNEMKEKITVAVDEYFYDYEVIAVRVQEQEFSLGSINHVSHIWDDGGDTEEELCGICGTKIDSNALENIDQYFGEHLAIIGGNSYEYGEDVGEVIISDAVVLEVLA